MCWARGRHHAAHRKPRTTPSLHTDVVRCVKPAIDPTETSELKAELMSMMDEILKTPPNRRANLFPLVRLLDEYFDEATGILFIEKIFGELEDRNLI